MDNFGMTNIEIRKYINKEDDDFKNNFVVGFTSDYVSRFMQFHVCALFRDEYRKGG